MECKDEKKNLKILDEKGLKIFKKDKSSDSYYNTYSGRVYTGESTNQHRAIFELKSDAVLIKSDQSLAVNKVR